MARKANPQQRAGMSFRATPRQRRQIEEIAARLTLKTDRRWTMSEVVELAVAKLAQEHGLK